MTGASSFSARSAHSIRSCQKRTGLIPCLSMRSPFHRGMVAAIQFEGLSAGIVAVEGVIEVAVGDGGHFDTLSLAIAEGAILQPLREGNETRRIDLEIDSDADLFPRVRFADLEEGEAGAPVISRYTRGHLPLRPRLGRPLRLRNRGSPGSDPPPQNDREPSAASDPVHSERTTRSPGSSNAVNSHCQRQNGKRNRVARPGDLLRACEKLVIILRPGTTQNPVDA